MTTVKGLDFNDAYKNAVINETQGFNIRLIGYHQLIQAKLASRRLRDLNDVEMLEEE